MSTNAATYVSTPGGAGASLSAALNPGAPGSGAPLANVSMTSALLYVVGGSAALSIIVGYLARKGVKPELGRFDVPQIVFTASGTMMVIGTVKTLAYHFHGHKIAQAALLLL